MLLVIDNQSAYIKKFKRQFLAEQNFDYVVFDHNQPITLSAQTEIQGILLSGGRGNPYEPLNLTTNFVAMMNWDVPVLGFCLGHEIISVAYGGRIKKLPDYHNKRELITLTSPEDPIFEGLNKTELMLQKKHHFHVSELPETFVSLGFSDTTPNEIIKHKDKPIYGFQSHPEVYSPDGLHIIKNFLRLCEIL